MINLDVDSNAETLQEQGENFYHGGMASGGNRWWDKSVQLAVTNTGKWNFLGEHSMLDGLTPVDFCEHLLEKGTFVPHEDYVTTEPEELLTPGPNPIDIFQKAFDSLSDKDVKDIQEQIDLAKADFIKNMKGITYRNLHYEGYGAELIKKSGASGDAFAQMAIQVAGYRLMGGKHVGTYESTTVRPFLHGRTEATRTVSAASSAFCKLMGMKSDLNRDPESKEAILKALQKAAFSHVKYTKKATMGLGVDRHFFGLNKMLKDDDKVPDLFQDPLFQRSKTWRLSTSTLPTCPGFGPVADDGLGVGYGVYENDMVFNLSSRTENDYVEEFARLLTEVFDEMKVLLE
jgi:carnitine O-acetyltransferase